MNASADKLTATTVRTLTRHLIAALDEARIHIDAQSIRLRDPKPPRLNEDAPAIAERFAHALQQHFEHVFTQASNQLQLADSEDLTLVDHDFLEASLAMDSMVRQVHARQAFGSRRFRQALQQALPGLPIDSTNDPLDAEQLGDSFNVAVRPLGYKAHYLLLLYREFNKQVFGNLDAVVAEANALFNTAAITASANAHAASDKHNKTASTETRNRQPLAAIAGHHARQPVHSDFAQGEHRLAATELPALWARLAEAEIQPTALTTPIKTLHNELTANSAAELVPPPESRELWQDAIRSAGAALNHSLLTAFKSKQSASNVHLASDVVTSQQSAMTAFVQRLITEAGNKGMQQTAPAAANLSITLLLLSQLLKQPHYSSAARALLLAMVPFIIDAALPQALAASTPPQEHMRPAVICPLSPAQPWHTLLNALANALLGWRDDEALLASPSAQQLQAALTTALQDGSDTLSNTGLAHLQAASVQLTGIDVASLHAVTSNSGEQLDSAVIDRYVRQTIASRVLGRELDNAIRYALDNYLQHFLCRILGKDGPESKFWQPALTTIDVLLWSVQTEKYAGDLERFERIRERLQQNLQKALTVGGASQSKCQRFLRQLKQIQEYSFHASQLQCKDAPPPHLLRLNSQREPTISASAQRQLQLLESLQPGSWFEYQSYQEGPIRCRLINRIESIDKFLFADSRGNKVLEFTKARLASDMLTGSMRLLSDRELTARLLESMLPARESSPSEKRSAQA